MGIEQKKEVLNIDKLEPVLYEKRNFLKTIKINDKIFKVADNKELLQLIKLEINDTVLSFGHSKAYLAFVIDYQTNELLIECRPFIGSA